MIFRETLRIRSRRRSFEPLTASVGEVVRRSGIYEGLCNVFIQHTSASLIISENADPAVGRDLESFMQRIAPDGSSDYEHDAEGPDDMPSHIRSVLTQTSLCVPVGQQRLMLGTWQGIFLWEHRHRGHAREVLVTVVGDS